MTPRPCPFCGSSGVFAFSKDGEIVRIICKNWLEPRDEEIRCMGSGPWRDDRAKAIAAWNSRATDKLVDAMEEYIESEFSAGLETKDFDELELFHGKHAVRLFTEFAKLQERR